MNRFPLEIDGKEYTLTVNRRNNVLAKTPQERLAKLMDLGVSAEVIAQLMDASSESDLMRILKENNVSTAALTSLNETSIDEYEDMFFQCLSVEHPMERAQAVQLLDKAEEEYGWDKLKEALEVMSAQGFTLKAAEKKKEILWLEQAKRPKASSSKSRTAGR